MLKEKTSDVSMTNTNQGSGTAAEAAVPMSHGLWNTWRKNLLLFCLTGVYVELCLHLCVFGSMDRYAGYPVLFGLLGGRFGLSRRKDIPKWMKSKGFRYGFLVFFFAMFFVMLWNTYLVFAEAQDLKQVVTLLWTFKLPWQWGYHGTFLHPGVAQFAFGFYSVMLTSTVLGLITMVLFKPRSWCVYCPMGTMTQLVCKARNSKV